MKILAFLSFFLLNVEALIVFKKCKHKIPKRRERCLKGVKKAKLLIEHVERVEKQFAAMGLPSYTFEEFLNAPTSWTPTTKSPKTTASPSMGSAEVMKSETIPFELVKSSYKFIFPEQDIPH